MKLKILLISIALLFSTSFKMKNQDKTKFDSLNEELKQIRLNLKLVDENLNYLESQDSLRNNLK